VFDSPQHGSLSLERRLRRCGTEFQIDFQSGDYLHDAVQGTYDVACFPRFFTAWGPEGCRTVIEKAASVLEPGGFILVHDFLLNDTHDGPLFPALFRAELLVKHRRGAFLLGRRSQDMLAKAGVRNIRRLPFRGPTDSGILSGTSPAEFMGDPYLRRGAPMGRPGVLPYKASP